MERRDFLRTTATGTISVMSLSGIFAEVFAGENNFNQFTDQFSLNKVAKNLENYSIPHVKDPLQENLSYTYNLITLAAGVPRLQGRITCFKKRSETGRWQFHVELERSSTNQIGYSQFIKAAYQYNDANFRELVSAGKSVWIAKDREEVPFPFSSLKTDVKVKRNKLLIRDNSKTYSKRFSGRFLIDKWSVPFLLQTFRTDEVLAFDLLDETDQVRPGQKLGLHKEADISFASGTVGTRAFLHTGPGTLPAVYWLTNNAVPFAIISGSEAYLLDSVS